MNQEKEELIKQAMENWPMVEKFLTYYPKYKVFFLTRGKGRVPVASRLDMATYLSLFIKHINRREEVILVPEEYTLFVDEPHPKKLLEKAPVRSLLVQTSLLKFQLHIPAFQKVPAGQEKFYQKALKILFNSEYTSWNHGRKIPGFYNWKYPDPPLVKIIEQPFSRPYEEFWQELQQIAQNIIESESQKIQVDIQKAAEMLIQMQIPKTSVLKNWNDFATKSQSYSEADLRYCIYLLSRGLSIEETIERLISESPNIFQRKKGHFEDYLRRTIIKAVERVVQNYRPPSKLVERAKHPYPANT